VERRWSIVVAIVVGGAIGAAVRALLGEGLAPGDWPWATFVANIGGTLMLAVLAGLLLYRPHLPHWLHPLVAVGFCGSLTTFSGLQLEAFVMMRNGHSGAAVFYVGTSIVVGLLAALVGRRAVQMVHA
jgi:CrcB protein